MMQAMLQRGGRLLLSPSDLNNFLACEHRTALDLARARGEILLQRIPRPDGWVPRTDVAAEEVLATGAAADAGAAAAGTAVIPGGGA